MRHQIETQNVYVRNGHFHFKKIYNGTLYRCSLHTKDPYKAKNEADFILQTLYREGLDKFLSLAYFKANQPKQTPRVSVPLAFERYIISCKDKSPKNVSEKKDLQRYISAHHWDWYIFDNPDEFADTFIHQLAHRSSSAHVRYKYYVHLKAFLKFCIKKGWYHRNEYDRLDFPTKPPLVKPRINYTPEDIKEIVHYCMGNGYVDFAYYFLTLFYTASRAAEPQFLKVSQLDPINNTITIYQSKANKPNQCKNKVVPVHASHMVGLMKYAQIQERKSDNTLFNGGSKHKGYYAKFFRDNIRPNVNINQNLTLQRMRPTAITHVVDEVGIMLASKMAGHSDISTTQGYYQITPEKMQRGASALAGMIMPKKTQKKGDNHEKAS